MKGKRTAKSVRQLYVRKMEQKLTMRYSMTILHRAAVRDVYSLVAQFHYSNYDIDVCQ